MPTFIPHFEILPVIQKELWPALAPCKDLGFTLYGGTAIALRLGHRASVDFDFFTHAPLDQKNETTLRAGLPFLEHSQTLQNEANTLTCLTENGVKLSFFGGIGFGRVGRPDITEDGILRVASLPDLFGLKLAVILKRVESKDYRDIAAMLRHGLALSEGLGVAAALYGPAFSPADSVRAMTYFEGGDLAGLTQADRKTLLAAARPVLTHQIPTVPIIAKELDDAPPRAPAMCPRLR